jgi:hypothetical protein
LDEIQIFLRVFLLAMQSPPQLCLVISIYSDSRNLLQFLEVNYSKYIQDSENIVFMYLFVVMCSKHYGRIIQYTLNQKYATSDQRRPP